MGTVALNDTQIKFILKLTQTNCIGIYNGYIVVFTFLCFSDESMNQLPVAVRILFSNRLLR
jgi:hypothetical protein